MDGDENRGQLFALTRVLLNARPFGAAPSMSHCFPLAPFLSQRKKYYFTLQAAAIGRSRCELPHRPNDWAVPAGNSPLRRFAPGMASVINFGTTRRGASFDPVV